MGKLNVNKRITVLGSTGSVGCNTLDLIERARSTHGPEAFPIEALTAQTRVDDLIRQARSFHPKLAVIGDEALLPRLREGLEGSVTEAAGGPNALIEAAQRPADWVMAAIVGAAGLAPTYAAIERGAQVALANKECLVCAGDLIMAAAKRSGAVLLPVDSEHNAIFQVLEQENRASVEKVILTASGGPFRTFSLEEMARVTPKQAIAHPNWSMGKKISVDSATMMNQGLEVIEAHYLFGFAAAEIEIVIHPQSVVHSLVAYEDGSVLAQLGTPDMRTPIAHTLAWPQIMPAPSARLDLASLGKLTFEAPDETRFPALALARNSLQMGGGAPTILNAANEAAVTAFLGGQIGFLDIPRVVEGALDQLTKGQAVADLSALEDVFALDSQAREQAKRLMSA